ncbi:dermatopontin [Elysia marginata]|uniref:Dermatopontin n=1 Tax=Elysia marginata TaxID=1093978 RepID=A0AAV4F8A8_9GAST|nr:dermatopontin [Elysia marginata]
MSQLVSGLLVLLAVFTGDGVSPVSDWAPGQRVSHVSAWGESFSFDCPYGQVIRSVHSVYSSEHKDRQWSFSCGPAPHGVSPDICKFARGYVNTWAEPIIFSCPADRLLSGVESSTTKPPETDVWASGVVNRSWVLGKPK